MSASFGYQTKSTYKHKNKMNAERMNQIYFDLQKIIHSNKDIQLSDYMTNTFNNLQSPSDKLLSQHAARAKQNKQKFHQSSYNQKFKTKSSKVQYKSKLDVVKNSLSQLNLQFLKQLFDARCHDLEITHNEQNWSSFLRTFLRKNSKINKLANVVKLQQSELICSQLNLKDNSIPILNKQVLSKTFTKIDLSKNLIDPNRLTNLFIKQRKNQLQLQSLILNNCALGNQQIETLLQNFVKSDIKLKVFSLSSPDVKDRNQLTKYDQLKKYILWNESLRQLYLSNIQIKKENPIFEASRHNKSLKIVDVSKNTEVCGMCKNLVQVNLSRNGISNPLPLRMEQTSLLKLDISFNNIPSYKLEIFLQINFYPSLCELILDNLPLNFQVPTIQHYLQRSGNLTVLSARNCQLSVESYTNICFGVQKNGILQSLDLSGNKFPASYQVAQSLSVALQTAKRLRTVKLAQCELRDQYGAIIFKNINRSSSLCFIDISKNLVGTKTSAVLCSNLKNSFYNLMRIQLQQNFVKYDHNKQLKQYVKRNQYLYRLDLQKQRNSLLTRVDSAAFVQKLVILEEQKIKKLREQREHEQIICNKQIYKHLKRTQQQILAEMKELQELQQILEKQIVKQEDQYQKILQRQGKRRQVVQGQDQQYKQEKKQDSQVIKDIKDQKKANEQLYQYKS